MNANSAIEQRPGQTQRPRMATLPRILFITPFWPHKATIGAEIRSREIMRALQKLGKVEAVVLVDEDAPSEANAKPTDDLKAAYSVKVKPLAGRGVMGKLQWIFNPRTDFPHGCAVGPEDAARVLKSAAEADVVWFYKLRSANMFPNAPWPHAVMDVDDVPSSYEQLTLENQTGMRKRFMTRTRIFSWKRRERLLAERFPVLTVCSEGDKQYLKDLGVVAPTHVVPNGAATPTAEPVRRLASPPRIGFIGLIDYFPNHDGIEWFAKHCWPLVKRAVPAARLRLVGKGSDGPLKPEGADIDGLGFVDDANAEIATWSAMIVPIRVGGGTRLKIAQGFGLKCPIVSTSLGAYGYEPVDGREMYLGDEPQAFADGCIKAMRQPEAAAQMAERAWQQFLQKWTWDAIQPRIGEAVAECLRRKSA